MSEDFCRSAGPTWACFEKAEVWKMVFSGFGWGIIFSSLCGCLFYFCVYPALCKRWQEREKNIQIVR